MIRWTHGTRFSDAQCGFKAARAEVVRPLLGRVEDDAWFFDTELLLLAEHNGLRIHEVPVDWVEDVDTRVDVVATARDDLRGLIRVARAKAAGTARVSGLPRRPAPRAEHPDAVVGTSKPGISWQLLSFAVIGVLSTVANLVLYAVLRQWMPILVANLLALVLCTLFNTEANRRFTFPGRRGNAERVHLKGLLVFGLYYAFTSGRSWGCTRWSRPRRSCWCWRSRRSSAPRDGSCRCGVGCSADDPCRGRTENLWAASVMGSPPAERSEQVCPLNSWTG